MGRANSSSRATGVVVSQVWIPADSHYKTEVRLDGSGQVVEVRYPHKMAVGRAVKLNGQW
jgi:hypothetical protein